MLADTDAGSLITASQSGAQWGYRMVLPEVILIPILYVVQEITVRLGIVTGQGHGALIRARFGRWWALLAASTLFISAIGALLTEFAGVAGVGQLFGISPRVTVPVATAFLLALAMTGSYARVERIGVAIGLAELTFLVAMFMSHPHLGPLARGLASMPMGNNSYLLLTAANVGAVIMPWMIFYQQGAVIDKGLTIQNLKAARFDTLIGSVLTQLIMIAVVIATAATIGQSAASSQSLNGVRDIAAALEPFLGWGGARVAFGLGVVGAGFIAAIVVSLAGSWGISEALRLPHSLNSRPWEARWFYLIYTLVHVGGALIVLSGIPLVQLTLNIEVINAVLLPIVLGFLLVLEARVLPEDLRMKGLHKWAAWFMSGAVISFGLFIAARTVLVHL
jgi:Mn2+/Fe2+ NRAMP family transporter